MLQTNSVTRFVAAIALLAGFAFAVPPASAAEDTDAEAASSPPDVCVPFTYEGDLGPVTYHIGGCVGADEATATTSTQTIPPCANVATEESAGPVTVGVDEFCHPYATVDQDLHPGEDPTEACSVQEADGPVPVIVVCELETDQNCYQVYWKYEVGPVVWEQRSSCDGDIYVEDDRKPGTSAQTSSSSCFYVYWKKQVGPVVWEQRSSCEGDIYVDDDWQPSDETPDTADTQTCLQIYIDRQVGPVGYEQSGCEGEPYVDTGWQP